jgi:curved DNA-binding protein CbpA
VAKKKTPYEVLGVDPKAGAEEIRRAHRKKARETHPDRDGSKEEFSLVQKSYETLIDPDRRRDYDETGTDERPGANAWVSIVAQVMLGAIEKGNVKERNLVKEAIQSVNNALAECARHTQINSNVVAKFDEVLNRLTEPDGHLARILEGEKAKAEDCNVQNVKQRIVHEQALEYLKGCKYKVTKPKPKNGIVETPSGIWMHPFIFTAES